MSKKPAGSFYNSSEGLNIGLARDMLQMHRIISDYLEKLNGDKSACKNAKELSESEVCKRCSVGIKILIEQGADINLKTASDFTLLHMAAFTSNLDLLSFLIAKGANVDPVDYDGQTLLHLAVNSNNAFVVAMVLDAIKAQKGSGAIAKINQTNRYQDTALHHALVPSCDPKIVKLLLDEGADCRLSDEKGRDALNLAGGYKNLEAVSIIKNHLKSGALAGDQIKSAFGRLTMFVYIKIATKDLSKAQSEIANNFIQNSTDLLLRFVEEDLGRSSSATMASGSISERIMKSSLQMIYEAIETGNSVANQETFVFAREHAQESMRILLRLVDAGADVNTKGVYGRTALHFANYLEMSEEVSKLLERRANPTIRDDQNFLPADYKVGGAARAHRRVIISKDGQSITTFSVQITQALLAVNAAAAAITSIPVPKRKKIETAVVSDLVAKAQEPEVRVPEVKPLIQKSPTERLQEFLFTVPKTGGVDVVTSLIAQGADINVKFKDGSSALRKTIERCNGAVRDRLLACDQLEVSTICDELEIAIKSGNKQLLSVIFAEENFSARVASLEKKARGELITKWRQINKSSNKEEIRKKINDFEKVVSQSDLKSSVAEAANEKVVEESAETPLSRNERDRRRKAASQIKAEQEEIKTEIRQLIAEVSESAVELSEARKIQDEQEKAEIRQKIGEIVEAVVRISEDEKGVALLSESEQMQEFLQGRRRVKAIHDLPPFLERIFSNLLEEDCGISLKGSAVYQSSISLSNRVPNDLDVEIFVPEISKWPNDEIAEFVREKFGWVEAVKIFRSEDGKDFTVNAEDESRGLDLSFYDPEKMPPLLLDWATSREEKIFFFPRDLQIDDEIYKFGEACRTKSRGFQDYLSKNQIDFDPKKDFLINPKARGLIFRLCFLEVTGQASKEEIFQAVQSQLKISPTELLFKEFKLGNVPGNKTPKDLVQEKILNFVQNHSFDNESKWAFVSNLSLMLNLKVPKSDPENRNAPQYQPMYEVVAEMLQPSKVPRLSSRTHVQNGSKATRDLGKTSH